MKLWTWVKKFQWDAFSVLCFWEALNHVSLLLYASEIGYKLHKRNKKRLSYLLYMDDFKLLKETQDYLHFLLIW